MSRFTKSTTFSTDLGTTLDMANCRFSYYGAHIGSGDFRCLAKVHPPPGDESVHDAAYRKTAEHFIKHHIDRVPIVVAARVLRDSVCGRPAISSRSRTTWNYRPLGPAQWGLAMYYVLAVLGLAGAVLVRRRRITLVPFVGVTAVVVVTAMATFGQTRYRVPVEVVLVILSAVTVDTLWSRLSERRTGVARSIPPAGARARRRRRRIRSCG